MPLPALLLPGIGAGLGALSSLFGGGNQSQTTTGDPGQQKYLDQYRSMALAAQGDPAFAAAMRMFMGAGGMDQGAATGAMNPYLSAMNPWFDQMRQNAVMQANQQATRQGAFGGSGSDIGAAVAGNQADITHSQFNYQAFQDAMQRLLSSGQSLMQLPGARMGLMQPGLMSAGSTTTIPIQRDPFMGLLGGGLAGYGAQYGKSQQGNMGMGF